MRDRNHIRIAMLGHKRIPFREGGVEVVVEKLAVRMAARGHSVTCYNRRGHHVSGREFDGSGPDRPGKGKNSLYRGIRLKSVCTIDKKGLAAMTSSVFASFAAAFGRYDVVHFHAEGPCAMLWLPKLCGKRCVATIHGLDHRRAKWGKLASAYILAGEKCAAKYADEIIVLSQSVRDYFKSTYHRDTIWIPNGVDRPDRHKPDLIRRQFGLEKDSYILYLGRIVPEKGVQYLIEAFRQIHTEKKLVIAGGASDTDAFREELGNLAEGDDRILFTGFVQGQLLEELYSNAYLYTLPSDLEGMPLSLLEAMSYGNCCLVSDIPECAEVVEDRAVTFRKGDVADLGEKLQSLCDDREKVKAYKASAADFICGKYSWEDVVDRTLLLYAGEAANESVDGKQVLVS